jgi:hypothetical protein
MNFISLNDDGSESPKKYKDKMKQTDQATFWESMLREFQAMETKGVWELVKISQCHLEGKQLLKLMEVNNKELLFKTLVKYLDWNSQTAMLKSCHIELSICQSTYVYC